MPLPLDPLTARERARMPAGLAEILAAFRTPTMPPELPYALLPDLQAQTKPHGYASLAALARAIHRRRAGQALQLRQAQVRFRDRARTVTEVLADDGAGRVRRIGFAWVAGRPWEALAAELDAQLPHHEAEG